MIPGKELRQMNLKIHQYNTDMGKKILGVIALVAIAAAIGWNYQQNNQEVEFSDLALANVEALAYNESSEHCERLCYYWPSTYCVLETSTSYIYCMEKFPK